jgi:hypothetical protein
VEQCPSNVLVKIGACESWGTPSLELGISFLVFELNVRVIELAGQEIFLVASWTEHTTVSSTRRGPDFTTEILLDALWTEQVLLFRAGRNIKLAQ